MADPLKYEKIYQSGVHVLGEPFPEIIAKVSELQTPHGILDLGAGQGRDAVSMARMGHKIMAVDNSPTGLAQLADQATAEGLPIETFESDLNSFAPSDEFDVLLADRTLHMLDEPARDTLLDRCLNLAAKGATILIADEKSNLAGIRSFFVEHERKWLVTYDKDGFLFLSEGN